MTCLALENDLNQAQADGWDQIRAGVFWGSILLVIVSPAVLGALILMGV